MTIRVGQGFDAHAFEEGSALVIGGVRIEDVDGLAGHSDADVLCHAIADALLGSAALGDLGTHFPADERWRDASSLDILRECARHLERAGWTCVNVDATVVAQRPKLAPYLPDARTNIARAIGLDRAAVSVKATTTDQMGFTGRGEGMAALAVVLVQR